MLLNKKSGQCCMWTELSVAMHSCRLSKVLQPLAMKPATLQPPLQACTSMLLPSSTSIGMWSRACCLLLQDWPMAAPALQQWALVFRGRMALQQGAWRAVRKVLKALAVLAPDSIQVMQQGGRKDVCTAPSSVQLHMQVCDGLLLPS